jgi:hypothetical protein
MNIPKVATLGQFTLCEVAWRAGIRQIAELRRCST